MVCGDTISSLGCAGLARKFITGLINSDQSWCFVDQPQCLLDRLGDSERYSSGESLPSTTIRLCGGVLVTDSAVSLVSSEAHGLLDFTWVVAAEHF